MRRVTLGLIAAASLTATHANAADVTVRGSPTCQAYMTAKHKTDTTEAMSDLVWLLGYMSGLAVGTQVDILARGDDGTSMLDWLDIYCQRFPTKYLSDAGDMYYGFLKQQIKRT